MKRPTKPTCGVCDCGTVVRVEPKDWQELRPGEWAYDHTECGDTVYAAQRLPGTRVRITAVRAWGENTW